MVPLMDNICKSDVSFVLNPVIVNVIRDHQHEFALSTCEEEEEEEEFENEQEIQQMLINAFDSQSLSNTTNGDHVFDDEDDDPLPTSIVTIQHAHHSEEHNRLQHKNSVMYQPIAQSITYEDVYRKTRLQNEQTVNELNEQYERKIVAVRLEYETKIEDLTNKINEQQIEIITLKQMYETILDEKQNVDQQIEVMRLNEKNLQDRFNEIRVSYEELLPSNRKSLMMNNHTQTDIDDELQRKLATFTNENTQLADKLMQLTTQLKSAQTRHVERELNYKNEKLQYEKSIRELLYKRPIMHSTTTQTDAVDDDKKIKQLQNELSDYKLQLTSKQMEINCLKFDFDNLMQELNDCLSLLPTNISNNNQNEILSGHDHYLNELIKLKSELPDLKQQMIKSFQTNVMTLKEQVKKSLADQENDYRNKLAQLQSDYVSLYEQALEQNKETVRSSIAIKQEEFNCEKAKIIGEYEEKLKVLRSQQLSNDERCVFEKKIQDLSRVLAKCSQYIALGEHEQNPRDRVCLNCKQLDETQKKYNAEIHRLYDQIGQQNQQQLFLIDEYQQQIERLKNTYDQRYRLLLDEWKTYNNDLREDNTKLKIKLKEYEKTIVQLH